MLRRGKRFGGLLCCLEGLCDDARFPLTIKRYPFPPHSSHSCPWNNPDALQSSHGAGNFSFTGIVLELALWADYAAASVIPLRGCQVIAGAARAAVVTR